MKNSSPKRSLLLVGNDSLGKLLIEKAFKLDHVSVALDGTERFFRACKLILNGRISPVAVFKIFFAELSRPRRNFKISDIIKNNAELHRFIIKKNIDRVIIFRGGLIINKTALSSDVEFLNVHCARIPEYGGLGAIYRALNEGSLDQMAVMHKVTDRVDKGEIIATKRYRLNPKLSFKKNENTAYQAGIDLIIENI